MIPDFIFESEFLTYVAVGFAAQIVDGALGMAYGTLSTAVLLSTGLPPVTVSASVHTAQFFTTGISGVSHVLFKNVKWRLVILLGIFGAIGGIGGATFLIHVDGATIKPFILAYLSLLGFFILWKLWRRKSCPVIPIPAKAPYSAILGFFGGLLDASGGGGWGPVVTSNLMAKGEEPRIVIGSVNTAEFFVKTIISLTFIITVGFHFTDVVLGLLVGGVLAAPLGAIILRFIKSEILIGCVGVLIVLVSLSSLAQIIW